MGINHMKWKVVARAEPVVMPGMGRNWLLCAKEIVSVGGVLWNDIPTINEIGYELSFGRATMKGLARPAPYQLAIRRDIFLSNFEIELV